ncbi:MAG: DUF362 domain-containing protein [Oscillospiraceae bacterium]|nr:DUF362 domain-containing protein [Oscillospiraceae bacterium]
MNDTACDVSVVSCTDYEPARVRSALEELIARVGGLDWVRPGMRVGIKANLVSAMTPDCAATTHPALIDALAAMLRERGAIPVVGDSPGGLYNAAHLNKVYAVSGIDGTCAERNRDFSTREIALPEAKVCKTAAVTGWLLDCDEIINFAKLKSHGMMGLSAAAKNLFGTIPGTMKPEYHFRFPNPADFADMLVDLDEFWKPRLHLVDAVVAMEGNGPTAGTPKHLGCLLAGENPHRIDLICTGLIGLDPGTVPTLLAAWERGLCPKRREEITVDGDWQAFKAGDFKTITQRSGLQFQNAMGGGRRGALYSKFLSRALAARPGVEKRECVGCRKCEQVCPAKAITMKRGKPLIERATCIRCFCCQEFCPKGAMKVRRPPLARILVR